MQMMKKIKELQDRVPHEHKDLAKYTQHVFEALDQFAEEHRRLVNANAIAGIKPDGKSEKQFYETLNEVKKVILAELEKTVQDIEHKGDKYWHKHYTDGIEQ